MQLMPRRLQVCEGDVAGPRYLDTMRELQRRGALAEGGKSRVKHIVQQRDLELRSK